MKYDLNCDLGEGESPARTRGLMKWITSANIACGGHAGNADAMERCVVEALRRQVRIGAHPGLWDRSLFGRGKVRLTEEDFELLLLHQIGALQTVAKRHRVRLRHVKLHGSLYHAVETDARLRRRFLTSVRRWWPQLIVYGLANGKVVAQAEQFGLTAWPEGFIDRAYTLDGGLAKRGIDGSVLTRPSEIKKRVQLMKRKQLIALENGVHLPFAPRTLCVHSDTPNAVRLAKTACRELYG